MSAVPDVEAIPGTTAQEAAQIAAARNTLTGFMIDNVADMQAEDGRQIDGMIKQFFGRDSMQKLWHQHSDGVHKQGSARRACCATKAAREAARAVAEVPAGPSAQSAARRNRV